MYATKYACTAFHCPFTHPRYMTTGLPVDFRQVGRDIYPPRWWNGRLQAHEEEWLAGELEEGSSTSESRASATSDSDIDAVDNNLRLPSIHTLGLWGLKPVAARQPDPPDKTTPPPTASSSRLDTRGSDSGETAQHQLLSPSDQTYEVPEQDSRCDTQSESRADNHERGRERSEDRDSASLQIEMVLFDNDGKQLKPRISDLAESQRMKRKERERKRSRNSKALRMVYVQYDMKGKRSTVRHV